jgi:RNA polymerase sigma-70 factor (ECF subfamily)
MEELTNIRQAREGDPEAFRALFDGHRQQVFALAYRYLRNRTDAEDVLQETFIKAYNGLPGYDPAKGLSFAAWLNRICVNASIDAMRRSKVRETGPLGPEEAAAMSAPSHSSDPERSARSAEIREKIDQALARLTPTQRMVFTLRHYQEYTTREIAQALQSSEGSVKKHLFRAVGLLRKHLRKYVVEDGYDL